MPASSPFSCRDLDHPSIGTVTQSRLEKADFDPCLRAARGRSKKGEEGGGRRETCFLGNRKFEKSWEGCSGLF